MSTITNSLPRVSLGSTLVRVCRELDVEVERLRAEQVLGEAKTAWPGDEDERWSKWLIASSKSLGLKAREIEVPFERAIQLCSDGALVVGGFCRSEGVHILVGSKSGQVKVGIGEIDETRKLSTDELLRHISADSEGGQPTRWIVLQNVGLTDSSIAERLQEKPIERLLRIVKPERRDIGLIVIFAFFAGVLGLATPVAVEALVNTVAFGQLLQPVVILAVLLFGFLAFAASMQALQTWVAEIIQRRLFARVSADLAFRLPRVDHTQVKAYGPELVNRFLDVATLQKVTASLLLDGVGIIITAGVGMIVLGFYHPWLLGFDVLLLASIVGGIYVLGRGAVNSGIYESKMKYKLTAWFQDLIRCRDGFKMEGGNDFAMDRANMITSYYLAKRKDHFKILFRQVVFLLGLQVVAATVLLGFGGWLVIQGQLSLGQLVAAELIVTTIVASLVKLGKHLESFFDLVAAVDKLGNIFDLPVEREDGLLASVTDSALDVSFRQMRHESITTNVADGLTLQVEPGHRIAFYGPARAGKSVLARMLYGMESPKAGQVEIGGCDPSDLRPDILRSVAALVADVEIFEGSIAENVHMRRAGTTANESRAALDEVGLLDRLIQLPDGVDTGLNASGQPLTTTEQRLLMIARAIAGDPRLLIIDSVLDSLPDDDLDRIATLLGNPAAPWTLVVMTGRRDVAERFEQVVELRSNPQSGSRSKESVR